MIRLIIRFAVLVVFAAAFAWAADNDGSLSVTWLGYQIDDIPIWLAIGAFVLAFFVLWFTWWLIRLAFGSPGAMGDFFRLRRSRKGLDALSKGMVAVGAGDVAGAQRQAVAARKLMADSPLAHLLEAQAAQMRGDEDKVKYIYTQMLDDPESEVVALRGLYTLARKSGDEAVARRHAERALKLNPALAWAAEAVMTYQSGDEDWPAALALIESQRKAGGLDREASNQMRAVVLTAQAQAAEGTDTAAALDLATKAHKLDPSLIPAAVIAGRAHVEQGALRKASKVLETTWKLNPHPDIAEVYRHARMGDSTSDRLVRARDLLAVYHGDEEGAVALATAAVEALDWKTARNALRPYCDDRPAVRICTLMAEIEQGEFGDSGRAREWLARAVRAPNDPAWTADGFVSPDWLPVSPTNGRLGAFEWKVPVAALSYAGEDDVILAEPAVVAAADVIEVAAEDVPVETVETVEPVKSVVEPEPLIEVEEVIEVDEAAEPAEAAPAEDVEAVAGEAETVKAVEAAAPEEGTEQPSAGAEATESEIEVPDAPDEDKGEDADDSTLARQPDDPGPRKAGANGNGKSWFN